MDVALQGLLQVPRFRVYPHQALTACLASYVLAMVSPPNCLAWEVVLTREG